MQRRIVDRVEPKTLFPFGAPGEGPRACGTIRWASPVIDTGSSGIRPMAWAEVHGHRVGLILGTVQSRTALFSCVLPSWVAKW